MKIVNIVSFNLCRTESILINWLTTLSEKPMQFSEFNRKLSSKKNNIFITWETFSLNLNQRLSKHWENFELRKTKTQLNAS